MSILIKSNSLYAGSSILPTAKQQSSSPEAVYTEYVARVEADGGEVTDKAKLMDAIQFMFKQNLYGRMSTVVAPLYGKKLDSNGKLLKLYAIDGDDLTSISYGGAPLPTVDSNNQVVFNNTITTVASSKNGSLMTTASKKPRSSVGRLGVASRILNLYGVGTTGENNKIMGLTEHTGYGDAYMRVSAEGWGGGTINTQIIKDNDTFAGHAFTQTNTYGINHQSSFITMFDYNQEFIAQANYYNPQFDSIIFRKFLTQLLGTKGFTSPTFIDWGGTNTNDVARGFGRFSSPFLWVFSDITEEHVTIFQKWQVKHYPLPL